MRYLITTGEIKPFFTDVFDPKNHFNYEIGMIVYDLKNHCYTVDGITWNEIEFDHL